MATVQQRMARGIVWMVAARLADRGIGAVSTLILARLLLPEDFGLVAMATAIGGILDLLGAFNFDLALIQNRASNKTHYDTVWTFNVFFGIFCGITLCFLAIPASRFYYDPRLEFVMYALAIPYVVGGFSNIGVVSFRKELRFRDEFKFILQRRVVTFATTVGCAIWMRSYWALVAGIVVGRMASVFISFKMSDYRPSLSLEASRELFNFSKWLFLNNSFYFLLHSGPNFVVGRIGGAKDLGTYTVAYEMSNLASTELAAPINRATFPGFASMKGVQEIASSYLKLLGVITLLVLPVGIGIAAVAEPMVLALLGENWISAIPLMQLLAIYGAISATQTNNGVLWMVLGRPRDLTIITAVFLAILFSSLVIFLERLGLVGIAYSYLLAQITAGGWALSHTRRLLNLSWSSLVVVIWRPVVGVVLMYFCVTSIDPYLRLHGPWQRLSLESVAGAAVYIGSTLSLWLVARRPSGPESYCVSVIRNSIATLARRAARRE